MGKFFSSHSSSNPCFSRESETVNWSPEEYEKKNRKENEKPSQHFGSNRRVISEAELQKVPNETKDSYEVF